jgi:hypothetical protein
MSPGRDATTRGLRAAIVAVACAYPLLYVAVALLRMRYPFELEWLEGGSLAQVERVLAGQAVYTRPTPDYVAFTYTPLYYYVAALASAVTGPGFAALRLVSFLASLASMAVIFSLVRRETGRAFEALVAVGLFAGTYRAAGAWLDVGRVDSLWLALTLLAVHRARFGHTQASQAAAGALLCLAFFTKQVAVVALLGLGLHHVVWRRRDAPALLGTAAAGIVAGTLLLDRFTGGWYTFHVFRPHGLLPHRFLTFWAADLLPLLPVAMVGAVLLARDPDRERRRFYAAFAAVMIGSGLFGRMIVGAYVNALLPACAGLAVLFGLYAMAFRASGASPPDPQHVSLSPRRAWLEPAVLGATLLQLAWLCWDPRACLPTAADRQAGERLVAHLARLGPNVLLPSHPYLAVRAGSPPHAHTMAIGNLLYFAGGPVGEALERDLRAALCRRRYSAVVTNGPWRYDAELERAYDAPRPLPELGDAFWTVAGAATRPSVLYTPRGGALSPAAPGAACRPEASAPGDNP